MYNAMYKVEILTWFSSWRKFWRLRVFLAAAAPVFQDHVLNMSGYFSRCDWWIFFKAPVKITIHILNFTYFAIIHTTSVQYLKCQNFSLTHLSSFPSCSLSQILEVLNKWKWCIFAQLRLFAWKTNRECRFFPRSPHQTCPSRGSSATKAPSKYSPPTSAQTETNCSQYQFLDSSFHS